MPARREQHRRQDAAHVDRLHRASERDPDCRIYDDAGVHATLIRWVEQPGPRSTPAKQPASAPTWVSDAQKPAMTRADRIGRRQSRMILDGIEFVHIVRKGPLNAVQGTTSSVAR